MFKQARIKLTGWYLLIIMAISLSFSGAIYAGINSELVRMDNAQRDRQARVDTLRQYLRDNSYPLPPEKPQQDLETIELARERILMALGVINLSIFVLSGLGGYFLAGQTLDPISKMMKDQKEFIGNASHELRTPLTIIKTEVEVGLRDKKITLSQAKDLLKSTLDNVNGMQKLSNYLLELNRFENIDIRLDTEKFDLGKVVSDSIDYLVPAGLKKGIALEKKVRKVNIRGNVDAVSELATILIDNAIKYSGKGKKVIVSVTSEGDLIVKDFGVGISKEDMIHIFDRFYRADSSRSKDKIDGYGLGLSIAKSIADKVGAKIKVDSRVGKGTTFNVKFLLA